MKLSVFCIWYAGNVWDFSTIKKCPQPYHFLKKMWKSKAVFVFTHVALLYQSLNISSGKFCWQTRQKDHSSQSQRTKRTKIRCRLILCPKLISSIFCSVATQHDTCPVCRKSLNGEDSSSQPPSESPSLSMDPRTQERWSFWDTHPSHFSVLLAYIQQRTRRQNISLFPLFISVAAIIISVWFFFFLDFNAFFFNHVYRNPNRRLNCHLRWLDLFFYYYYFL